MKAAGTIDFFSAALLLNLYQVEGFSSSDYLREREEEAYSNFVRFIEESDSEMCKLKDNKVIHVTDVEYIFMIRCQPSDFHLRM